MPRLNFLSELHKVRDIEPKEPLSQLTEKIPCKQVLDEFFSLTRTEPQPATQGKSKKQLKREQKKLRRLEAKAKKREEALSNKNTTVEQNSEQREMKSDKDTEVETKLQASELVQKNNKDNEFEIKLLDAELVQKNDKNNDLENAKPVDGN